MSKAYNRQAPASRFTSSPYSGRRGVLATMHGKEAAISPAFRKRLGLRVETPMGLDTDALGTFTGEIARVGTIRETAIAKARLGMAAVGIPIGIASEGSYGPHPLIPFIAGGIELMALVDDDRGIVVCEHLIDDAPAYDHVITAEIGHIDSFLDRIRFPGHALIVRPHQTDGSEVMIHKGLRTVEALANAIASAAGRSDDKRALVQTDMRAHMNPTRMATISRLANSLCDRLATLCPGCAMPGYGLVDVEYGLPCEWCGAPSLMALHYVFGCVACDFSEKRPRPDGRTSADPGQCPKCNP